MTVCVPRYSGKTPRSHVSHDSDNKIDLGIWDPADGPTMAAHEAGHLMGLPDRYDDVKDKNGNVIGSKPRKGWKYNIMAVETEKVEERDIGAILDPKNPALR